MLKNYKKYFPWFLKNKSWIYADSSATSLKPKEVINAVSEYYEKYCTNPHNNDSSLASKVNEKIKSTRELVANFLNVKNSNQIIFSSGATESLNLIINNVQLLLKPEDEVLITYAEHSSNLIPWIEASLKNKFKLIFPKDSSSFPSEQQLLNSINKNTKIISFTSASNLFGYTFSIQNIVKFARKKNPNIIIIVDATQYIPHHPINIDKLDVDFLVFSMHKMCGPSGVGILFGKMKHLEKMTPMRLGGGTVSSVEKNLKINYSPIPHRFEGGTPNTEGILATYSAIKFLQKIGMENVEKHEIELKKYFDKKIKDIKNIDYASKDSLFPVIALNYKGINPQDFANYFGKNKIIVRGGTACVKLAYMFTGNKSGYVRISLYIYNDFSDIDKIINVIKKFKPSKILEKII